MDDSNNQDLLPDFKSDSSYQPLLETPSVKIMPNSYTIPTPAKVDNLRDSDIETYFKLYKYVIYVYLVLIGIQLAKGVIDLNNASVVTIEKVLPVVVSVISFCIWFFGNHGLLVKNPRTQFRFQGLLVVFMMYYAVLCTQIVMNRDSVLPSLTVSSFGLNAVFGIIVPVLVYYRADDLRLIFEQSNPKLAVL